MPEEVKRRPVRKFFKSFVDVRRWFLYDRLAESSRFLIDSVKRVLAQDADKGPKIIETFEEAKVRLNLSELALIKRKKYFLISAIVYLLIGIIFITYGFYLLVALKIIVALVTFIMGTLMFVYAYRESFWYMQMSKRKLGCTFKEWILFVSHRNGL